MSKPTLLIYFFPEGGIEKSETVKSTVVFIHCTYDMIRRSTKFMPNFKCLNRLLNLNRTSQINRVDTEICTLQNQVIKSSHTDSSVNPTNFNGHAPGHTRVEEPPAPPETSGSWVSVHGKTEESL